MAKTKTVYVCSECGATSVKWQGRCSECGEYNTFEEQLSTSAKTTNNTYVSAIKATPIGEIDTAEETRY